MTNIKDKPTMSIALAILMLIAVMMVTVMSGCTIDDGTGENQGAGSPGVSRGEHEREGAGEDSGEHGEESGTEYTLDETYDEVRNGARLILSYDASSNAFNGMVENITSEPLKSVRVEVHLSNGIELGPTTPVDLTPGDKVDIRLPATDEAFDGWSAHPEVGGKEGGEHSGDGGEHESESGEHGGESGGEHGNGSD